VTAKPNPRFPACAHVARRLLAEVYGCRETGERIPDHETLIGRARQVAADPATEFTVDGSKARIALQMVEEIGGL
jgi:hypothetical protein